MTTRIKLRRDTAANWTTNDPILALGEAGYDTTNNQLRVGDGTTAWSLLSAVSGTSNKITAEKDYSTQYDNDDVALFTYTTGSIAVQFYPNVGLYLNDTLSRWIDYFRGDTSLPSNYSNIALVINSTTTNATSTVTNVTSNENDPTLYTITLASAPAGPITIDTIDFNYTFSNAIGLDNDNAYYGMAVADENINFHSGRDINLYAADDFRINAGNYFSLQLKQLDSMDPYEGIEVVTMTTSTYYNWTFRLDGGLGLPDTGLIDNNGGITRFKSTDNDGVQLGSTDDQNYVTVNTSSVTIQTNSDALGGGTQYNWTFRLDGNLEIPPGGGIFDTNSRSVSTSRIGDTWNTVGDIHQLTMANDEGTLITVAGSGIGVFRLPQITQYTLGAEFEFYFAVDAGQIHIQSYYTGQTNSTDDFRGSIFVGVDNATTGKLHKATSQTSTACDLFLGQHHAKAGSYIKVKCLSFDGYKGAWLFQGMCVGDTGQTPNSSDHPFQDYNA